MAVNVRADLPSGDNSAGIDTETRLIFSSSLSEEEQGHLNLSWQHDASPAVADREHRYGLILGYARSLSGRTSLVSDLIVRQHQSPGKVESIVELGLRHALAENAVMSVALGAGVNPDAPRYCLLVSFEQGF